MKREILEQLTKDDLLEIKETSIEVDYDIRHGNLYVLGSYDYYVELLKRLKMNAW